MKICIKNKETNVLSLERNIFKNTFTKQLIITLIQIKIFETL